MNFYLEQCLNNVLTMYRNTGLSVHVYLNKMVIKLTCCWAAVRNEKTFFKVWSGTNGLCSANRILLSTYPLAVLQIRIYIISLDPDPYQKLGWILNPDLYQIIRIRIQQKPLKTENKSQLGREIYLFVTNLNDYFCFKVIVK